MNSVSLIVNALTIYCQQYILVVSIYLKEPPPNGTIPESVAQFMESVKSRARECGTVSGRVATTSWRLPKEVYCCTMKPCYNGLVLKPMCPVFGK